MNNIVDLHMHSTYSDGSCTPEQLVQKVRNAGIHTFALTDHDTVDGIKHIYECNLEGLHFIAGIEFSTITPYRQAHILGYNCDLENPLFKETIEEGIRLRRHKLEVRLDYLKEDFGIVFSDEDNMYLRNLPSCAKPHLARMLMKYGYGENVSDAITKYLDGAPLEEDRIQASLAIKAIKAANGIAIWAHPYGGENKKHMSHKELEEELQYLMDLGIDGLEVYYSRFSLEEEKYLEELCYKYGLLRSAGSDYHGSNKTVVLGCLNKENKEVVKEKVTLLKKLLIL